MMAVIVLGIVAMRLAGSKCWGKVPKGLEVIELLVLVVAVVAVVVVVVI